LAHQDVAVVVVVQSPFRLLVVAAVGEQIHFQQRWYGHTEKRKPLAAEAFVRAAAFEVEAEEQTPFLVCHDRIQIERKQPTTDSFVVITKQQEN
jgi:hypothetical protein